MGSILGQTVEQITFRVSHILVPRGPAHWAWKVISRSRNQLPACCLRVRFGLFFLFSLTALSDSNPIVRPARVCNQHAQLTNRDHMKVGVRIVTASPALAESFRRALDFWTRVLDMEWYQEQSDACSLQLTDAEPGSLDNSIAADAQLPGSSDFEGWICFNAAATLTRTEMYYYSVHEIGHLLGLGHNPSHRSVMYFEDAPGPERLDETDLRSLSVLHKMRVSPEQKPIYLQISLLNRFPIFQQLTEWVLSNKFQNGFIKALATGKRHRTRRNPVNGVATRTAQ